jgi:hypothetical protein
MAQAYVRICIHPGHERNLRSYLRSQPEVISAEITAGEQDMIAQVKGDNFEAILVTKVRVQEGVKITWTNFILD